MSKLVLTALLAFDLIYLGVFYTQLKPVAQIQSAKQLKVAATTHWVDLAWSPSATPNVSYVVHRTNGCKCNCIANAYFQKANIANTVWTDNNVIRGKTYCYYVRAIDNNQVQSDPSNSEIVTVP